MPAHPNKVGSDADVITYNRMAWDSLVDRGDQWTVPVTTEQIRKAARGDWKIVLTPTRPVPRHWFGDIRGKQVLCLAGGGGQQGPILAAAGANVTVVDNSPKQLGQDRMVADRDQLDLKTVLGEMSNLSALGDGQFDLVVHPCSNGFVADVRPVWREAFRVLKSGGELLAGFINPVYYLFDYAAMERGELEVRYQIPYSDSENLPPDQRRRLLACGEPLEFGHSLEDQLNGQMEAGFVIIDLYEDSWPAGATQTLSTFIDVFMATRAKKVRHASN